MLLYSVMPVGQRRQGAKNCKAAHVLTLDPAGVLSTFLTPEEMEEYSIDEELLNSIGQRVGNALINNLNAQMGVDDIALSSIRGSRSLLSLSYYLV